MLHRRLFILLALYSAAAHAQWLNFPTPGIPRSRQGKPNLTAPTPRAGGKPDLSGLWETDGPPPAVAARLFPNGNGSDEIPSQYFINILFDFAPDEPLVPAAAAALKQRAQNFAAISPLARCLPSGLPIVEVVPQPYKIIQTPGLIAMLYERDTTFRQVYTDGTERFHRIDFGHMDVTITFADPKTFTKPVTIALKQSLRPDTDVLENFCNENERDVVHMGK
jgi:hypothetical protein